MKLIYSVAKDFNEAKTIGETLVKGHLAACVNIIDGMSSIYWWDGVIEYEKEAILLVKTRKTKVKKVMDQIKLMHSYKTPAIFCIDIEKADPEYLKWIKNSTNG